MPTVPAQTTRAQATAFAGQTIFTYPFLILEEEDIKVYLTPVGQTPDPTADLLTLNVDYTVTGVGNATGGTIVLVVAATLNDIVTMERDTIIERTTDFSVGGQFTADAINLELDRLTMISQEIETQLSERGLTYQVTDELESNRLENILPPLTANSGNLINIWSKSAGGALVNLTIDEGDDVNTLRSELASQVNGSDGALLVGYFDSVGGGKTIKAKLDEVNTISTDLADNATHASCGATLVGYNADSSATTVRDELDTLGNTRSVPLTATLIGSAYTAPIPSDIFPFTSYNEDSLFKIKFLSTNPGAVTLNINSIGAKDLKDIAGNALAASYFDADSSALIYFDATADEFRILTHTTQTLDTWADKATVQADSNVQEGVYLANFRDHPGIARAWVGFSATSYAAVTIKNSFNIASVVGNAGPNNFTINLSVTMSDAFYATLVTADNQQTGYKISGRTSSSFDVSFISNVTGFNIFPTTLASLMIYGPLA